MCIYSPDSFHITQFTFSKLQELRNTRIRKEQEAKQMFLHLHTVRVKLEGLKNDDNSLLETLNALKASFDAETGRVHDLEEDFEVMILAKQGQDEVASGLYESPKYDNAVLLPSSVVQKFNRRIQDLSDQHVQLLNRMMVCRRRIGVVQWETQRLSLVSSHLSEYYTDLQMYRVTRGLQRLLREGSSAGDAKERLDKVGQRKDFVTVNIKAKKGMSEEAQRTLRDRIRREQRELDDLRSQLAAMQQEADEQNAATANDSTDAHPPQGGINSKDKMQYAVTRSQYSDRVRRQAEEIETLTKELDRMRLRTFPTFVKLVDINTGGSNGGGGRTKG